MKKAKLGKLIIIVAPSGVGKTTLIKKLREDFFMLKESVSYTTRAARVGEEHGKNYFYISLEEFNKMKDNNEFVEWAEVHGNYYGTSKKFVEDQLQQGNFLLFDIDVQGTDNLKAFFKDKAKAIFIKPPSMAELEQRLRGRGTDSEDVIRRRMRDAIEEMLHQDSYDYSVVNDNFDRAYAELKQIVYDIMKD